MVAALAVKLWVYWPEEVPQYAVLEGPDSSVKKLGSTGDWVVLP